MVEFLNLKNGQIYNPDARAIGNNNSHFTEWFDDVQSVNGIYAKRIIIVATSASETITLIAPTDSKFFFIKNRDAQHTETIDGRDFTILERNYVSSSDLRTTTTAEYTQIYEGENYFYSVIIYTTSQDAGTFEEEVELHFSSGGDYIFTVGADFYNEDESLTSNLENFGVEIPSIVQKALFPVNLREDLNDNIHLNEKRRELLMNYWDVVASKGSYNSLIKSLKWFGYGDLVRIEEYWKRLEANKIIYVGDDIETVIDDLIESQLSYMSKTTYCGLYMLLNRYDNGLDSETNPNTEQIDEITLRWAIEDLSIKMTLLGNFFATYFMPIHLNLIHSTIERRCFTLAHAIFSSSHMSRRDYYNCNMPINVNTTSTDDDENRNVFYLEDVDGWVYPNTIFANTSFDNDNIIGCEPLRPVAEDTFDNSDSSVTARHHYVGIGKIVKFSVYIPEEYVAQDDSDCIWKEKIMWSDENGGNRNSFTSYVPINVITSNSGMHYKFDCYILFTNIMNYNIKLEFETLSRRIYTKILNIKIEDGGANKLKIYKIKRLPTSELLSLPSAADVYNSIGFNDFMFRNTQDTNINSDFTHCRLMTSLRTYRGSLGLNHTLRFVVSNGMKVQDEKGNSYTFSNLPSVPTQMPHDITQSEINQIFGTGNTSINVLCSNYWWDVRTAYTDINQQNEGTVPRWVVTGIRKYFSTGDDDPVVSNIVDEKEYSVNGENGNFKVTVETMLSLNYTTTSYFVLKVKTDGLYNGYSLSAYAENELSHSTVGNVTKIYVRKSDERFVLHYVLKKNNVQYCIFDREVFATAPTDTQDSPYENEGTYQIMAGSDDYKMKVYDSNNVLYTDRLVDEDRFAPIFHTMTLMDEPCVVDKSETVAVIPHFKRSYSLNQTDEFNWKYINRTTGQELQNELNNAPKEPFVDVINFDEPGYIDVELKVKQVNDGTAFTDVLHGAFKLI